MAGWKDTITPKWDPVRYVWTMECRVCGESWIHLSGGGTESAMNHRKKCK